jgi:hypothetical protein
VGRLSDWQGLDAGSRRLYTVLAWGSLLTVVLVGVYGLVQWATGHGGVIGNQLVDFYWPYPPYFAQPVTYLSVACVVLFYAGLRLWEERMRNWPKAVLSLLTVIGFVVAFSAAYEVIYNFMLWGATYSIACLGMATPCDPDTLFSSYPLPWNLVFATRAFSALFVVSGYSVYYLRRLNKSRII